MAGLNTSLSLCSHHWNHWLTKVLWLDVIQEGKLCLHVHGGQGLFTFFPINEDTMPLCHLTLPCWICSLFWKLKTHKMYGGTTFPISSTKRILFFSLFFSLLAYGLGLTRWSWSWSIKAQGALPSGHYYYIYCSALCCIINDCRQCRACRAGY